MSGSLESMRWNACVRRLDLALYSHPKEMSKKSGWLVGCLLAGRPSNTLVRLRNRYMCCHTGLEVAVAGKNVSPSHGVLTPDRPVPVLILYRLALKSRVAAGEPIADVTGSRWSTNG